jgi:hypothetical protein
MTRPVFGAENGTVRTDHGTIPWDIENDRPVDHMGEGGRLYALALEENEMSSPDPWSPPTLQPIVPTVEQQVLFDHENRVRALEGQPPITIESFISERMNFRG